MTRNASRLAWTSLWETMSFLLLLAMMLLHSETGVSIAGMIHGLLFMAYAFLVLREKDGFGWSWGFVAVAILTGPVGAIVVLERMRRQELLARA